MWWLICFNFPLIINVVQSGFVQSALIVQCTGFRELPLTRFAHHYTTTMACRRIFSVLPSRLQVTCVRSASGQTTGVDYPKPEHDLQAKTHTGQVRKCELCTDYETDSLKPFPLSSGVHRLQERTLRELHSLREQESCDRSNRRDPSQRVHRTCGFLQRRWRSFGPSQSVHQPGTSLPVPSECPCLIHTRFSLQDKPGDHSCGYCGLRFVKKDHHH